LSEISSENVEEIGQEAFVFCVSLVELRFPKLKTIPVRAF